MRIYPHIEWSPGEYRQHMRIKVNGVLQRILSGGRPVGPLNLFSGMPAEVMNPPLEQIKGWKLGIDRTIKSLQKDHWIYFDAYYFRVEVVETGENRGVLKFHFWLKKPTTTQRVFDPGPPDDD